MPYLKKKYTPQFKFDRSIEAVKTDNLSEISRKYDVSVTVLSKWRQQLLSGGKNIFEQGVDAEAKNMKTKISKLEQIIGKKEIELNLLKNFSDFYQSPNTS